MIKKLFGLLFFVASIAQAQYTIKGTMTPPPTKQERIILYKMEGAKQRYKANATAEVSTVMISGDKQDISSFTFALEKDAPSGVYRITYTNRGNGFVDFIFNKENVEFIFNSQSPEESVVFSASRENKVFAEYLNLYGAAQSELDALQVKYVENQDKAIKKEYKTKFKEVEKIQDTYENKSEGMFVHHLIKANKRENASSIIDNTEEYLKFTVKNFFENIDFESKELYNTSVLIDRINDYVFYLNYSDDAETQRGLQKGAIEKVMDVVSDKGFKKEILEYLISVFTDKRDGELVDYIIEDYYDKLPDMLIDDEFKNKKLALLTATVGRTAPDFSWTENGGEMKLSSLNDADKYLLVFWSTGCSHCVREVPDLHKFMQAHKNVSVVSFGIEYGSNVAWKEFVKNLPGWHHAMGTHPENKFENEIVQQYNLLATPSYFVLDKDKKIIAMPNQFEDIKKYFEAK